MHDHSNLLRKLASLLGIAGASLLISLPVSAQTQGGALNPRPSIFNEPPYNRTPAAPAPGVTPPVTPAPPTSPVTPTPPTAPTTPPQGQTPGASNNIVALAAANGSFKTLTAALQAAGLTETLSGQGPFTVFAPTDEAFAALPQDALQELLRPENKQLLVQILTYHVVPASVQSTQLQSGEVKTVEGEAVTVKVNAGSGVTVNDARVVQPDIQASNGIIHAIDKVLLPPSL